MKPTFFLLSIFIISISTSAQDKRKWEQLFNGKDLKDWNIKISKHDVNDNYGNRFQVKDEK